MRQLLFLAGMLYTFNVFADFVHPMDFDGSQAQKDEVIEYIRAHVQADYCNDDLNMCQPSVLRMMEKENLDAFKKLTKVADRNIIDGIIDSYCNSGLDMCNYSTILMMYKENFKASRETLEW